MSRPSDVGTATVRQPGGSRTEVSLLVDLPSGGWAAFKHPDELMWRDRKLVERNIRRISLRRARMEGLSGMRPGQSPDAVSFELDDEAVADGYLRDRELTLAVMLRAWSYPASVPTSDDLKPLEDVPSRDFSVLSTRAELLYQAAVVIDDVDEHADPKAGTPPSGG